MDTPQKPMSPADAKWARNFISPSASSALPPLEPQGQSARSSLATGSALLAALIEATDMAEGLVESMDYLGTGSDSQAARKEQKADEERIAHFRAIISAHTPNAKAQP